MLSWISAARGSSAFTTTFKAHPPKRWRAAPAWTVKTPRTMASISGHGYASKHPYDGTSPRSMHKPFGAAFVRPRRRTLLAASRNDNNNSNNDSTRTFSSSRPRPPVLDSMEEEDGYGASSYVPNDLDEEHWNFLYDEPDNNSLDEDVYSAKQPTKEIPVPPPPPAPPIISNNDLVAPNVQQVQEEEQTEAPPQTQQKTQERKPTPPQKQLDIKTTTSQPQTSSRDQADNFLQKASSGLGVSNDLDVLEDQLERLTQEIRSLTQNPKFNPNSLRQVSEALFDGDAGQSTNKDVLEALAASAFVSSSTPEQQTTAKLADLILRYRQLSRDIVKRKKRQENRAKGTYAKSVYTVQRTATTSTSTTSSNTKADTINAETNPEDEISSTQDTTTSRSEPRAAPPQAAKPMVVVPDDPLILVDASAYIFRAYYAYPPLHRSDGMPIGAVLGFCNMLNKLVLNMMMKGEQPRIALVFDAPGKTFRHEIYQDYKANRAEAPVDLIPQFGLIRQVATAYGIAQLEAPTFEADDVIATLANMAMEEGVDTNILSGDKDLMQLVTPSDITPCVQMIDPGTMARVSYETVVEKWGVPPEKLGDVLALAGDSSDNIPGVPGIGPKIAASLIEEYGSLLNLLDNMEGIKQKGRREKLQTNEEQARLSRQLVELDRRVPIEALNFPQGSDNKVAALRMSPMDVDKLVDFFEEMGLKDLKQRFERRLQVQRGTGRGGGGTTVNGSYSLQQPNTAAAPTTSPSKGAPPRSKFTPRPKARIPTPDDFSDVPF